MKANMSWLLVMLLAIANAHAQTPSLLLVNKQTGANRTIADGSRVGVSTRNGKHVSGPMTILNDSVVEIKQTAFTLDDILSVRGKTRQAKLNGAIVAGAGAAILIAGIAIGLTDTEPQTFIGLLEQESAWITGGLTAGVGLAITATGVVILSSPRTFSSAAWTFHIER